MKILLYLTIFFVFTSCSVNKGTYWCGDHPCINKKEREAYFKKTMIVEIKQIDKNTKNKDSEFAKVMEQALIDEEKRIKKEKDLYKFSKLEEKRKAKEEKQLLKQAKLEEKRKAKEEKKLLKQAKLEEKRKAKEEKYLAKKIKKDEKKQIVKTNKTKLIKKEILTKTDHSNFSLLVEKITKRNAAKPYPNINNIPE